MIDHAHTCCRNCPTARESIISRPIDGAEYAIILDAPTESEGKVDRFFAGKRGGPGALLEATIGAAHGELDDLYIGTAVNCRPNVKKKAMQKNAMIACRERLLEELKEAGVKKVLSVGAMAYSALMSSDKLLAPTKIRGRWRQAYGMDVLATIPPGFMFGKRENIDYFRDFAYDIEKFFTTDGKQPDPHVQVWRPDTLKEADEAFEFLAAQDFVSCDLETTGLSPIAHEILAAGFGAIEGTDGTTVVFDEALLGKKKVWRRIAQLLASDQETVFHNAKFDLQFFITGFTARGLKYAPRNIHDTMMLHYTLDERPIGRFSSHNLETLARVRYDAPDYGINVGKWLEQWAAAGELDRRSMRHELHVYLGLDAYYTARLFPDLWNEALRDDPKLLDLYEDLLMPGSLALAEIEHHGVKLNVKHFKEQAAELDKRIKPIQRRLQRKTGRKDFNPGSPQQVKEYIYDDLELPFGLHTDKDGKVYHTARRGGLQEGPTAAPVLKSLAYRFPEHKKVIDDICEFRNLQKNVGTYVNGLLNRVDVDGRMRTSFRLAGTSTGRLSSSDPNLQNIPDASHTGIEIRAGFVAPRGYKLIEADYKQLEVRIAAWLSDDDQMREIFESGRDPHQEIAFSIYRKPKEQITHYMRWLAKNILFGLLYGRGYESVATGPEQEDIAARGGQRWGLSEVKEFYDNLLAEWADFAEWQRSQKELGYKDGEITMPTGRHRRFAFIPKHDGGYVGRASFNNPIQGTASDFCLYALISLHHKFEELYGHLEKRPRLVLTVHDSLMVECPNALVDEVSELIETTMTQEPLIDIDVPLAVDIDVSQRWGEKEFEKQHVAVTADV